MPPPHSKQAAAPTQAHPRKFWMRWRVRIGYPVAVGYWLLASPTPRWIAYGAIVAAFGLMVRAAGRGLSAQGPGTRRHGPVRANAQSALFRQRDTCRGIHRGRAFVAGRSLIAAYFGIFYYAVMRNEEADLRERFGSAFDSYAARVPLFFPKIFVESRDRSRPRTAGRRPMARFPGRSSGAIENIAR